MKPEIRMYAFQAASVCPIYQRWKPKRILQEWYPSRLERVLFPICQTVRQTIQPQLLKARRISE